MAVKLYGYHISYATEFYGYLTCLHPLHWMCKLYNLGCIAVGCSILILCSRSWLDLWNGLKWFSGPANHSDCQIVLTFCSVAESWFLAFVATLSAPSLIRPKPLFIKDVVQERMLCADRGVNFLSHFLFHSMNKGQAVEAVTKMFILAYPPELFSYRTSGNGTRICCLHNRKSVHSSGPYQRCNFRS